MAQMNSLLLNASFSSYRGYLIGLLVVLLIANGIRFYRLTNDCLNEPEGYSIVLASLPTDQYLPHIRQGDIVPSIYPIILRQWYSLGKVLRHLFLPTELKREYEKQEIFTMQAPWTKSFWEWTLKPEAFWGRLFSLLFGLGSIILLYFIGKKMVNDWVGLISAILLALSPTHIRISREITLYSVQLFILLGIFLSYLWLINGGNKFNRNKQMTVLLSFIVCGILGILIHLSSMIFIFLLFLWAVVSKKNNPFLYITFFFVFLIGFSWDYYWKYPLLAFVPSDYNEPVLGWENSLMALGFLDVFIIKSEYIQVFSKTIILISLATGFTFSLRKLRQISPASCNPVLFLYYQALGMFLLFYIVNSIMGFTESREWIIYLIPFVCLILSVGFDNFPILNWKYRLIVLILILDTSYIHSLYFSRPLIPFRNIANRLNTEVRPLDRVIVLPNNSAYVFDYYFQKPRFRMSLNTQSEFTSFIDIIQKNVPRVWLIRFPFGSLHSEELNLIKQLNTISRAHDIHYAIWNPVLVTVTLYEMNPIEKSLVSNQ